MPNIFLVEDDSALSELIASYLQRNDFHVRVIARGDHVLDAFRQDHPDLVILDLMLPVSTACNCAACCARNRRACRS